jgi:hypothetical protein
MRSNDMAYVEVEIDLDEFSNEELIEEFNRRSIELPTREVEIETLTQAWIAGRNGDKDKAYALMWEYTLNKLGKVL